MCVSKRCRARAARSSSTAAGEPVLASSIRYVPVVADLLHRHQRRVPVDRARRTARGDRRRGRGCRARASRSRARPRSRWRRRRRPSGARGRSRGRCRSAARRGPARAASTSAAGVESSFGITSNATRTPSGSASRQISSMLRSAADARVVAGAALGRRRAEVHDQRLERNPARDVQRRVRFPHRRLPRGAVGRRVRQHVAPSWPPRHADRNRRVHAVRASARCRPASSASAAIAASSW